MLYGIAHFNYSAAARREYDKLVAKINPNPKEGMKKHSESEWYLYRMLEVALRRGQVNFDQLYENLIGWDLHCDEALQWRAAFTEARAKALALFTP